MTGVEVTEDSGVRTTLALLEVAEDRLRPLRRGAVPEELRPVIERLGEHARLLVGPDDTAAKRRCLP